MHDNSAGGDNDENDDESSSLVPASQTGIGWCPGGGSHLNLHSVDWGVGSVYEYSFVRFIAIYQTEMSWSQVKFLEVKLRT
jgi:hypothetical protein